MAQESTSSEKGVYSLCQKLINDDRVAVEDLFVVFISNEVKKIPVWNRKDSNTKGGRVVRDYHIFCIQRMKESEDLVWDLDSDPPSPSTISSYISQSIRPSSYKLYAEFQRVFSVVHAQVFLRDSDSDWRHMKVSKTNWTAPPESEVRVAESEVIVAAESEVAEAFSKHFTKEEMISLVEYNDEKIFKVKLKKLKTAITQIPIPEEAEISEVIKTVKQHVKDAELPEIVVVRILWDVLMDAVQLSRKKQQQEKKNQQGKNQQRIGDLVLHQVKTRAKLLKEFCTTKELQLELLYNVQVECYEGTKLRKLFPEIVRKLKEEDVLDEETILLWFREGTKTNPKERESFVKALEPFFKEIFEMKVKEMKTAITTQMDALPESVVDRILWDVLMDAEISEVIETVKQHVKDDILPEMVSWDVLMDAVQWSGKNQQQNAKLALRQVITWGKLLIPFYTSEKLQLKLLDNVQVWCYEDMGKVTDPMLFPQIVRILYDKDVLDEETILLLFRKVTNPKGRKSFVKALEPFFKEIFEVKVKEMKTAITTQMDALPENVVALPESVVDRILWDGLMDAEISKVIETVKQHVGDALLPKMVRILWDVLMDAVQWSGKNQQQNAKLALRQVITWGKLLKEFCTTEELQLELLYEVQVKCNADTKLMNLFPKIVKQLYAEDVDVLDEETILLWFHEGTNPMGREIFVKALQPFVTQLEQAEEED